MKKLLFVLPLVIALTACNGILPTTIRDALNTGTTAAATISSDVLTPTALSDVQSICNANIAGLAQAVDPNLPATVTQAATYFNSYCTQLAAAPAGQVPATTTATTSAWLTTGINALQVAAKVAGIVLPLVLPAL